MHAEHPAGLRAGWRWIAAALSALLALSVTFGSARPAHAAKRLAKGAVGNCNAGADWATFNACFAARRARQPAPRLARPAAKLVLSPTLTAAANWKSLHMSFYRYMTHDDPAPPSRARPASASPRAAIRPAPWWGENIAYGYATPRGRHDRLAQLRRPPRQHRERELPRDRDRRRPPPAPTTGRRPSGRSPTAAPLRRDARRKADCQLHADAAQPPEHGALRVDDDRLADERHLQARRARTPCSSPLTLTCSRGSTRSSSPRRTRAAETSGTRSAWVA